jgi:hypothetical protein
MEPRAPERGPWTTRTHPRSGNRGSWYCLSKLLPELRVSSHFLGSSSYDSPRFLEESLDFNLIFNNWLRQLTSAGRISPSEKVESGHSRLVKPRKGISPEISNSNFLENPKHLSLRLRIYHIGNPARIFPSWIFSQLNSIVVTS